MKLEYDQWLDLLAKDSKLRKDKIDVTWMSLINKRKDIQKDLFDLLYANRYLNFSYEDQFLHFQVDEDNVKPWNKRFYHSTDTYFFVKERVPQVLKQTSITRYTAEKIAKVIWGMRYCDDLLSKRNLLSDPKATKTTEELFKEKRHDIWIQLEIPFDENNNTNETKGESKKWSKYSTNRKNFLTDEQLDELYKKDDDEKYYQL